MITNDYLKGTNNLPDQPKKMLQDFHRHISEISLAAGFDSSANFSRVFKKQTSLSPKEYQEKRQIGSKVVSYMKVSGTNIEIAGINVTRSRITIMVI